MADNVMCIRKRSFDFISNLNGDVEYPLQLCLTNNEKHEWKVILSCRPSRRILTIKIRNEIPTQSYNNGYCQVIVRDEKTALLDEKKYLKKPIKLSKKTVLPTISDICFTVDVCDLKLVYITITFGSYYEDVRKSYLPQKKLLDEKILTDFTIKTLEKDIPCHKFVLAAESRYFRAMFLSDMKESKDNIIDWTDVFDSDTVEDMLYFIYTGQVPPNIENTCFTMVLAADLCELNELKNMVDFTLVQIMTVSNAVDILRLAVRYEMLQSKGIVEDFILEHYDEVRESPGWSRMNSELLESILAVAVRSRSRWDFSALSMETHCYQKADELERILSKYK